jgi:hypothetical protein
MILAIRLRQPIPHSFVIPDSDPGESLPSSGGNVQLLTG